MMKKGALIKDKIPTVTSEFGEVEIINNNFYFVTIFNKDFLSSDFLNELNRIRRCKFYGFEDFLTDLKKEEVLSSELEEKYIQVQYNVPSEQMIIIVDIHSKLKALFKEYKIFPINQLEVDLKEEYA